MTTETTLTDQFLPEWHFRTTHNVYVRADCASTFSAVKRVDLSASAMIRHLFALRGLPRTRLTLDRLVRIGFIPLGERKDRELLLGIAGRFWTPGGDLLALSPAQFRSFDEPGYARASWDFRLTPEADGTRLTTETRIHCSDARSRTYFRIYWAFVGPFSGLVRRRFLDIAKREAESPTQSTN